MQGLLRGPGGLSKYRSQVGRVVGEDQLRYLQRLLNQLELEASYRVRLSFE